MAIALLSDTMPAAVHWAAAAVAIGVVAFFGLVLPRACSSVAMRGSNLKITAGVHLLLQMGMRRQMTMRQQRMKTQMMMRRRQQPQRRRKRRSRSHSRSGAGCGAAGVEWGSGGLAAGPCTFFCCDAVHQAQPLSSANQTPAVGMQCKSWA